MFETGRLRKRQREDDSPDTRKLKNILSLRSKNGNKKVDQVSITSVAKRAINYIRAIAV